MPTSAFVYLKQISTMMTKGAAASVDDTVYGLKAAIPASIDDPAVKGKSFNGLHQEREIPAFINVLKAAVKNRLVIIPTAVALNAIFPAALEYVLAGGGAFLAYEAGETVLHGAQSYIEKKRHPESAGHGDDSDINPDMTPDEFQQTMEKGFKSTDIVMTSEVTGIAMGAMKATSIAGQLASLTATSVVVSTAVFASVFGIIRADNKAMDWQAAEGDGFVARSKRKIGENLMKVLPKALNGISYLGTTAMFWIGGELIIKPVPALEHIAEHSGNLSLAFAGAVGLTAGVGLAAVHKVAAPFIDPPLEKVGSIIKSTFNNVSGAISTTKNNAIGLFLKKEKSEASINFDNATENKIEKVKTSLDQNDHQTMSGGSFGYPYN